MGTWTARRLVAATLLVVTASAAMAPAADAAPARRPRPTQPAPLPPPPPPPVGRPLLEIQGPDPLVVVNTPTGVTIDLEVRNLAPVDDTSGISVTATGPAAMSLSTGTCSRALKAAGDPLGRDRCFLRLGIKAGSVPGSRLITVRGGPNSIGDSVTVIVQSP